MRLLKTVNQRYYKSASGKNLIAPPPPRLIFQIDSDRFVPGFGSNGVLRFNSTVSNWIYIDMGDATPVQSYNFTGLFNMSVDFYAYSSKAKRQVTIWFMFPEKVDSIYASYHNFVGEFPTAIGLYSFKAITFRATPSFDNFPINISGGVFTSVELDNTTRQVITSIPEWILASSIVELKLGARINLGDKNISKIGEMGSIKSLQILGLWNNNIGDNSLPDTLKNISTLRTLSLGANPLTNIPAEINNCKQITSLIFGYGGGWVAGGHSTALTTWGVGIANMPNLLRFEASGLHAISATLPHGLETAPNCKTLVLRSNYLTQSRIDALVDDAYSRTIATAIKSPGNTLMRQINCNISWLNSSLGTAARPNGIYQAPSGFVLGTDNGSPASQMEKIYVLTKQYGWTVTIMNAARNGTDTLRP